MTTAVQVLVASNTQPGVSYRVLVGGGEATCTCPGYEYRQQCWHLAHAMKELGMNDENSQALVPLKVEPPKTILPSRDELSVIADIARTVVNARGHAVPQSIDSSAKAMAVMLAGHELGVKPMSALRHITVINGRTEPDAQLMAGIVAAREPDAAIDVLELTAERCTVRLTRPSRDIKAEYTYEIEDARRAGLVKQGSNWEKFPKDMLRWAAVKRICRVAASDLINSVGAIEVAAVDDLLEAGGADEPLPTARRIEATSTPRERLYNEGDEAPANVDPVTGEIHEEQPAAAAEPADGEYTEEPDAPTEGEAKPARFGKVLLCQDWVREAARKERVSTADVMEAMGLTDNVDGYERMALDTDAYQQKWRDKVAAAKEAEKTAKAAAKKPAAKAGPVETPEWVQYLGTQCLDQDVAKVDLCRFLGCEVASMLADARRWLEARDGGLTEANVDALVAAAKATQPVAAGTQS